MLTRIGHCGVWQCGRWCMQNVGKPCRAVLGSVESVLDDGVVLAIGQCLTVWNSVGWCMQNVGQ